MSIDIEKMLREGKKDELLKQLNEMEAEIKREDEIKAKEEAEKAKIKEKIEKARDNAANAYIAYMRALGMKADDKTKQLFIKDLKMLEDTIMPSKPKLTLDKKPNKITLDIKNEDEELEKILKEIRDLKRQYRFF